MIWHHLQGICNVLREPSGKHGESNLIWDMPEDVRAEVRLGHCRFYEPFYFQPCRGSKSQPGKHSCEQQSSTVMPLTDESEASDLNREIILRIFRAFSAGDFCSPPLSLQIVIPMQGLIGLMCSQLACAACTSSTFTSFLL